MTTGSGFLRNPLTWIVGVAAVLLLVSVRVGTVNSTSTTSTGRQHCGASLAAPRKVLVDTETADDALFDAARRHWPERREDRGAHPHPPGAGAAGPFADPRRLDSVRREPGDRPGREAARRRSSCVPIGFETKTAIRIRGLVTWPAFRALLREDIETHATAHLDALAEALR